MVGLDKERQFLEGIQRVQGSVSSLHGLDIMKPETRSYLEGKMGEMKAAVNSVNGDFSDQRLTNAIGGLAGKISNDPVIQNGVISTINFRKGQSDIEESKKNGKYSVENEWDFQNEAGKWLNDKDYTSRFDHQYTPYIDVRKKVMDVIKSLDANELIDQNPFVTDSKGNIMIDNQTGKPILNYDIIEKHYKGKSADRIINAITASLDSNDFNQLAITGRYVQKNAAPIEVQKDLETSYKDRKVSVVNAIAELSVEKLINTNDPQYQKDVEDKIQGYKNELSKLDLDYNSDLKTLTTNPDAIKSNLYIKSFLNGISSAFASEERYTKYVDNPAFNNFMEQKRYELDKWYKEDESKRGWAAEQRLEFEAMTKGANKKGANGENDFSYNPTDYPVGADIPSPTEIAFRDETNSLDKQKFTILEDIVDKYAHDEFTQWKKVSQNMEAEGQKPLNKEVFLQAQYKRLKDAWDKKQDMPQPVEEQVSQLKDIDQTVETRQQALSHIKDKADEQYPNVASVTEGVKSQFVMGFDGKKKEYTPEDITDMVTILKGELPFASSGAKKAAEASSSSLTSRKGEVFSVRNILDIRNMIGTSKSWRTAEKNVEDKGVMGRSEFISNELEKSGLAPKPKTYSLKEEKGEDKNRVTSLLRNFENESSPDNKSVNIHPDFKKDVFNKILSAGNYTTDVIRIPNVDKYGQDKFEVIINGNEKSTKGEKTKMYITPEQAELITDREFTAKFSKIIEKLQFSQNGTTNMESSSLTGKYAGSAFLTKTDFPNVQSPIKADISKSAEAGKYFITLYTQDDKGEWVSKEVKAPNGGVQGRPSGLTIEQVEGYLLNMNDTELRRLFTPKQQQTITSQ